MTVTALAPWFGSNRMLAEAVGQELRGAAWVGVVFAGSMTELRHVTARTTVVNDLHGDIIRLARIVDDPKLGPELEHRLMSKLYHPTELAEAQARMAARDAAGGLFLDGAINDELFLSRSEDYFVCVWMGRSGVAGTDAELRGSLALRWEAGGGDNGKRYYNAVRGLSEWRALFHERGVTFSQLDCFKFLSQVKDRAGHAIYLDPPFPDAGDAYVHKFTPEMHARMADTVDRFEETRVVLRFYDHPLVRELYPEGVRWTWRRMAGRDQANQAKPEVLIVNGPLFSN